MSGPNRAPTRRFQKKRRKKLGKGSYTTRRPTPEKTNDLMMPDITIIM